MLFHVRVLLGLALIAYVVADLRLDIGVQQDDDDDSEEEEFDRENLTGEKWFYTDDAGERVGPFFFEDIKSAFFRGRLNLMSRVWKPEWENWRMFKTIPGLRSYLKENLDVKQQLQLIAVDDQHFVNEIRRAEATTPGGSTPMDGAMLCSKGTALAEVLRRGISKSVLKEIVQEAVSSEIERGKLLKAIRAMKYKVAMEGKARENRTLPLRTELAKYIKALKIMQSKTKAEKDVEGGGVGSVLESFVHTSVGEEAALLLRVAQEEPSVLVEPVLALLCVLVVVGMIIKVFVMMVQALRQPIGVLPPPPPAKAASKKTAKGDGDNNSSSSSKKAAQAPSADATTASGGENATAAATKAAKGKKTVKA